MLDWQSYNEGVDDALQFEGAARSNILLGGYHG